MRLSTQSLALGLVAGAAHAQFLVNELSFGHSGRITPDRARGIPNFQLLGSPQKPEILSNKLVLTPGAPAPGGQRGAVWSEGPLEHVHWTADVDFRVSGPERGSGNLNIWLARDGPSVVGTASAYTAKRFEGLVLVLDTTGPSGSGSSSDGALRGYLSDGSRDFQALSSLDGLAFGQCAFAYRNLGRPSQIKVRQTASTFAVEVDGAPCFASEDVFIPRGYYLGVTAASADVPDAAEIFKVVVMTGEPLAHDDTFAQTYATDPHRVTARRGADIGEYEKDLPDANAESIVSSKEQFADLHNRLQSVNHHLSTIFSQIANVNGVGEQRHEEVSMQLGELKNLLGRLARLDAIEDRLEKMERDMRTLNRELKQTLASTENSLKYHVSGRLDNHHDSLAEQLRHPGHSRLILVIVGGQLLLVASYLVYKRRKANSPKKYL